MTHCHADLTLPGLLDDPMTQAVMAADRVDRSDLESMLRTIAAGIAPARGPSARGARACLCAAP